MNPLFNESIPLGTELQKSRHTGLGKPRFPVVPAEKDIQVMMTTVALLTLCVKSSQL